MKTTRRTRIRARRLFRACLVRGVLDEGRAREAARRVAAAGRRGRLAILSHFLRLVKLEQARHRAVVETASALPPELRKSVEAGLARLYGPGLSASFSEDPSLIGGMRVRVASDIYDGSVRAALGALGERF
ncbi:MAG TPA: F0F1 ATP synthase subunit delta [Vicinamibacteria bacterium]|nr:F0F1 ATP synthase subunit delta [Vicinamibacteria bacterium]